MGWGGRLEDGYDKGSESEEEGGIMRGKADAMSRVGLS